MRSFTVIAAMVCLTIVVLQIAQADARRECREPKLELQPADTVTCDRRQGPGGGGCANNCRNCYDRDQLVRRGKKGCLVDRKCVCLGRSEEPTTTEGSAEPTTTEGAGEPSTAGPGIPSSEQPTDPPTTQVVTDAPAP